MDILDRLQDVIVVHFQSKAQEMGTQAAQMAMQGSLPPKQIQPGGGAGMAGMAPNPDELRRVLGATGQVM